MDRVRVAVLGASGYTGADFVRLAVRHPRLALTALIAKGHAGQSLEAVFPHLGGLDLPDLITAEAVDWSEIDVVVAGLPHAASHETLGTLPAHLKIIDMSADFRLKDAATYTQWYGNTHSAPALLAEAAYGLTEHNRAAIAKARLVACPGCYPTATLLALLPVVEADLIDAGDVIIDAKSGVSGAGRTVKQNTLFCEAGEGLSPYGIASHRHAPEIEQELSRAAGRAVIVNFTPHLVPMSRGELVTIYARLEPGRTVEDVRAALVNAYQSEPFVRVLKPGTAPATQNVRGSNACHINVFADRVPGRVIVIAAIDNLVKGSAGQALQNLNLVCGLPETTGLEQVALFP